MPYRTRYVSKGCAHAHITRLLLVTMLVLLLGGFCLGGYMMRLAGRGVVDPVYSTISQRCFHITPRKTTRRPWRAK